MNFSSTIAASTSTITAIPSTILIFIAATIYAAIITADKLIYM